MYEDEEREQQQATDHCIFLCQELFDIASELNRSDVTRTSLTERITSYIPEIADTLIWLRPE